MTEREKMLAGELYVAADPELVAMRRQARDLIFSFNRTAPGEIEQREGLLRQLFGKIGPQFEIEPPFHCDYGCHIYAGDQFFMNFNCVILDVNTVHIGDQVMFGPNVQIYTASHPLEAAERAKGPELGFPVRIGNRVWIGGGAIICPGVTIGDDTTIGAGAVVTRDIPAGVFAAGNPCRVVKKI
ncbi:MAG: sugar O-acetyltransferase [Bacteroidetes bacterium]|nr:MAG: sugar O-acetyltransferase [Bacteroidota bacterium]